MTRLETLLWRLYLRGDPRISVLESFQREPYTYVKVFVDYGEHGITVQEITKYGHSFYSHKDEALASAIEDAIKKAANLITERVLSPIIDRLSCESM